MIRRLIDENTKAYDCERCCQPTRHACLYCGKRRCAACNRDYQDHDAVCPKKPPKE